MGRIKRLQRAAAPVPPMPAPAICPLCEREIPDGQCDAHHFVPRSHGGRDTWVLHRVCHRQIHALFTEQELASHYHTVERLRAHPAMARFLAWVRRRPPGFIERVRRSERTRTRRTDHD